MSEHNEAPFSRDSKRSAPAAQIERLVSGDLSESERLELLGWLDESPERWRGCGLAFLEAQCLREALLEMNSGTGPRTSRGMDRHHRLTVLRVGAGVIALLVAFLLGWSSHRGREAPAEQAVADGTQMPGPIDALPGTPDREEAGERLPADAVPPDGLAMLRFSTGSGDEARDFSVPVRFTDGAIEVLEQPAELPEYVRQQWERRGFQVRQERQTLQLTLENGSQLNVPVARFLLTYVGQPML